MSMLSKIIKGQMMLGFLSVLIFWQALFLLIQTHTIPSPIETLLYIMQHSYVIVQHTLASTLRILAALAISLVIGVPTGLLLGGSKKLNRLFSPFLYYIYPVPKVAFLPVFMILYGLGNLSKIMLIIWIVIFQIILSVRDGVAQIPESYVKVMDGFTASTIQRFRFLVIPAILPYLFTGIRISVGISLASLFFAENYATTYGLGYFIISAWTKMNYVEMFSGIFILGFLGLLFFKLLDMVEAYITPWTKK